MTDLETIQFSHLVNGLKSIVDLKDVKEVKCPVEDLLGNANEEGWSKIHPRMAQGLRVASDKAQKILDTIPKTS